MNSKPVLIVKTNFVFMPLGIGYVLAALQKHDIQFEFWDMLRPSSTEDEYFENIRNGKYSLVATGGFVFNINEFIKLGKRVKELNPSIPFVLGGNITRNIKPEQLFEFIDVDYVYLGEAEASFVDFILALKKGLNVTDIPGIAFRDSSGKVRRNSQHRINLAEQYLMPAYEQIDVPFYIEQNVQRNLTHLGRGMPMLTGRGCTGGCSFCSPTVGKFLAPSVYNTMQEIEFLNAQYEFEYFSFITEIFFEHPYEIEEFCVQYKKLSTVKPWFCCVSPHMSPEVYPIMRDAGCVGFNMGLESGSDRILAKTKLGCTTANFARNYKIARKNNLYVAASFMVGNESEDADDMRATFDFLIENKIQQDMWGVTTAYPGTSIYAKARRRGQVTDEFAYLQQILSSRYWKIYNIAEFDYMNISAISNNMDLYSTIVSEARRYYSFVREEFMARGQRLENELGENIISRPSNLTPDHSYTFLGVCCSCGGHVQMKFTYALWKIGAIEYTAVCQNCLTRNFFNLLDLPAWKRNVSTIKKKFSQNIHPLKVIVVGRGKLATDLMFYDFLGLQLDDIVCVVDLISLEDEKNSAEETPTNLNDDKLSFFAKKRIRKEQLSQYDADFFLMTEVVAPWQIPSFIDQEDMRKVLWLDPAVEASA